MSFDNLVVNVDKFRETDPDLFNTGTYSDTEIKALGYLNGKATLKDDCYSIFNLTNNTSATTILDGLVTQYENYFQTALMYIQLVEFYKGRSGGFDELNYERSKLYQKTYDKYIQKFNEFKPTNYQFAQTKYITV